MIPLKDTQDLKVDGEESFVNILLALASDECEAAERYKQALEAAPMEEAKAPLKEILDDELNHLGKLVALMSSISKDAGEKIAAGIEGE